MAGRQTIDQLNNREGIKFWKDDVMYGPQNAIYQKLANSDMFLTAVSCIWKKEKTWEEMKKEEEILSIYRDG